jgi:hypothetical protein
LQVRECGWGVVGEVGDTAADPVAGEDDELVALEEDFDEEVEVVVEDLVLALGGEFALTPRVVGCIERRDAERISPAWPPSPIPISLSPKM